MVMIAQVDKIHIKNTNKCNNIKHEHDYVHNNGKGCVRMVSLIQSVQGERTHKGGSSENYPGCEHCF